MIQGLLEAAGIPSMVQRLGIDGPTLGIAWADLKGGSHRVMVHAERLAEARTLLAGEILEEEVETDAEREPWADRIVGALIRLVAWSVAGFAVMLAIFFLTRGF